MCIDFGTWTRVVEKARRYSRDDIEDNDDGWWDDHVFIAANMRPVGARDGQVRLACRFYDREHSECRAYDQRPPMCRRYPWYGREPSGAAFGPFSQCSFLLDLPPSERPEGSRPLIPLTVVSRPAAMREAA